MFYRKGSTEFFGPLTPRTKTNLDLYIMGKYLPMIAYSKTNPTIQYEVYMAFCDVSMTDHAG
jgi:hypothetical protein